MSTVVVPPKRTLAVLAVACLLTLSGCASVSGPLATGFQPQTNASPDTKTDTDSAEDTDRSEDTDRPEDTDRSEDTDRPEGTAPEEDTESEEGEQEQGVSRASACALLVDGVIQFIVTIEDFDPQQSRTDRDEDLDAVVAAMASRFDEIKNKEIIEQAEDFSKIAMRIVALARTGDTDSPELKKLSDAIYAQADLVDRACQPEQSS